MIFMHAFTPASKHYEHEIEFFQQFLDPYMKYGAGEFSADDSFEAAALRMLTRCCDAMRLRSHARVLDVGSGWGSFLRRVREIHNDVVYHHVNPSSQQVQYLSRHLKPEDVTFHSMFERVNLQVGTYDAILFQDSYCHLTDQLGALERAARALCASGRIVFQDTFFLPRIDAERHQTNHTAQFIQHEVFGYARLMSFDTFISSAAANGLQLIEAEDISEHYLRTVMEWIRRLRAHSGSRPELRESTIRYLQKGAACLGHTTAHYFLVLAPCSAGHHRLRANVRRLRSI